MHRERTAQTCGRVEEPSFRRRRRSINIEPGPFRGELSAERIDATATKHDLISDVNQALDEQQPARCLQYLGCTEDKVAAAHRSEVVELHAHSWYRVPERR